MKKKNSVIISVLIISSIIIGLVVLYLKTDFLKTKEQLFWKYFLKEKDEIVHVLSNDETKKYEDKIKKASYIKEGDILVTSENNLIKPIDIEIIEKGNRKEEYGNTFVNLSYDGKEVNKTTIIKDDNYYFVKNDLVSDNYVGFENNNLKQLAKNFGLANTDFIPNKIKKVDYSELLDFSDEDLKYISKKYIPICRKIVKNKDYTKEENVELKGESGKIVSYKVEVTEKQLNNLIIDILKELSNDEKSLNILCNKIRILDDENKYCDINNLKEKINEIRGYFEQKEVSDEIFLSIIIYKKENDVIKTEFVLNNNRTISVQTDKNNKIVIKQYDIKDSEISLKTFDEVIRTVLNTITEITYEKKIVNGEKCKVCLNIKCNLGIENLNINYNYVEKIENNVEDIIRKDDIKYLDLNNAPKELYKNIKEKVLKINASELTKKY